MYKRQALYNIDDRDDYTLALTQKLTELGLSLIHIFPDSVNV